MNSGFASLAPLFPREPVYLFRTNPPPREEELSLSYKDEFFGSYAAFTSLESIMLFARLRRSESSL